MKETSIPALAKMMKDLDVCMMTTFTEQGHAESRPMSNNADVEYDGHSYFFADEKSEVVHDIDANHTVNLAYQGDSKLYISVAGKAEIVRDKTTMKKHWTPDVDKYFPDGIDSKGVVMIHVKAAHIRFWKGEEEGEVNV